MSFDDLRCCVNATPVRFPKTLRERTTVIVMNTAERLWEYLQETAGVEGKGAGQAIAEAAGVSAPQASRWKSGTNRPGADQLVAFARHYGKPPVEILVVAGYLTEDEASQAIEIRKNLNELTDDELIAEVRRRMKGEHRGLFVDSSASAGASDEAQGQEVSDGTQSTWRGDWGPTTAEGDARKSAGVDRPE